jgi:hypothetical protein
MLLPAQHESASSAIFWRVRPSSSIAEIRRRFTAVVTNATGFAGRAFVGVLPPSCSIVSGSFHLLGRSGWNRVGSGGGFSVFCFFFGDPIGLMLITVFSRRLYARGAYTPN